MPNEYIPVASTVRLQILAAILTAVAIAAGCGSSNNPTTQQLTDFVTGAQTSDGVVAASFQAGAPPAANGGPTITVTAASTGTSTATVVSGGSSTVSLRASSPFQTVYLSVVDDPLTGYYKFDLSSPTTTLNLLLKLGSSIPVGNFQTVFSVALGTSVGAPSSIADTNKTPTSVAVTGTAPTLGGGTQQFTATATFSDNTTQDVTSSATWASSAAGVATVSSAGVVSAVAAGTASITATYGSISGSKSITISAASATFTVNGTVTDGTDGRLLPGINIAIGSLSATTDANGNYSISGISAGSVTIVAAGTSYLSSQQTTPVTGNTTVNFMLARILTSITAPSSCVAPSNAPVNCTFVGSTNVPSANYQWTFAGSVNSKSTSATGQTATPTPTFDCSWSSGNQAFQVTVTLTVSGGGYTAMATPQVVAVPGRSSCG